MNQRGKVALVTGAARRVGKVIALELAGRGMHVVVHHNRSKFEATQTAWEIKQRGVGALPLRCDLSDPAEIERMFERIRRATGRLDVLVNSASVFQRGDVLTRRVEDWDRVMDVNLRAPFLCSQQAARLMLDTVGSGVIINIADTAGRTPWAAYPEHSISNAGLLMMTKVFARALGPQVRVNAVVPGPVLKPDLLPPERWKQIGEKLPMGRTGRPENIARAVLALIDNDFVTGSVWDVDGGDALINVLDAI